MLESNKKFLSTIIVASLICIHTFTAAINMNNSFIIIVVLLYLTSAYAGTFKLSRTYFSIILILTACSLGSYLLGVETALLCAEYCILIGLFLSFKEYDLDYERLFKILISVGYSIVPLLYIRAKSLSYGIGTFGMDSGAMMGMTYAILPLLLMGISSLFVNFGRLWKCAAILIVLVLLFILSLIGSRGFFVAFASYFMLVGIVLINQTKRRRILALIISVILLFVLSQYSLQILNGITSICESIGLEIYALNKMNSYLAMDNLDNGRFEIWNNCVKGFLDSPFGHSIGSFEELYDVHQHNILLQTMWEFGIIGIVFLVFYIYRSIKILIDDKFPKPLFLVFASIFCSSIVLLFYSSSFWVLPNFWLWTKIVINYNNLKFNETSVTI